MNKSVNPTVKLSVEPENNIPQKYLNSTTDPLSVKKTNPFAQSDNFIPTPPTEMQEFVGLLSDANLSNNEVDEAMNWPIGTTANKMQRWPELRELRKEARLMAMRAAGLDKAGAYKVYVEGLKAEKAMVVDGSLEYVTDHDVRIKAADRVATLLGEKPLGNGGTTIAVGVQINLSTEERELLDAYRKN